MVVNQRDKVDWVMVELTGVADPGEGLVLLDTNMTAYGKARLMERRAYCEIILGERRDG